MKEDPADQQQSADYAMALDLSSQLTQVLDEEAVLHRILEIFFTLFAPRRITFWVMEKGTVGRTLIFPESPSTPGWRSESPHPPEFPLDPGWRLPDTLPDGFRLGVPYKDETIGIIEVIGLKFPQHQDRYLSLALSIAGVCGLAVANARAHHRLESALADLRQEYDNSSRLSEELRIVNSELEDRVRLRTAELQETARRLEEEVVQRRAAEELVRARLEEKTVLLRELHHRVKNNLQLIISMMSTQARKARDPALQLAFAEMKNRIRTMAAIHEKLWSDQDMARISLEPYCRYITSSLYTLYQEKTDRIGLTIEMPEIFIDINTAIPVGLILNELIANSLKHAFPPGTSGTITLSIRDEGPALALVCQDDGRGMPVGYDCENPETVGLLLVQSLAGQLQGSFSLEPVTRGTRFVVRVRRASGAEGTLRGTFNEVSE